MGDMFSDADAYDPVHALGTRASLPRATWPTAKSSE